MRTIYQPNKHTPFDAVILGNGDFPTRPLALYLLKNAPYICCCDGAGRTLIEHKMMPHAIVGDCDSLPQALKRCLLRHGLLFFLLYQDTICA